MESSLYSEMIPNNLPPPALKSDPDKEELLSHYRTRIDQFEAERIE